MAYGYSERMSEQLALIDQTLPTNAAAGSFNTSPGIYLSKGKRALYLISVGAVTATGTLDGRLQASVNSNFAGASNIANTNLTQITASNIQAKLEIQADIMPVISGNLARYVRLNTTVGTTAVIYGAIGLVCGPPQNARAPARRARGEGRER